MKILLSVAEKSLDNFLFFRLKYYFFQQRQDFNDNVKKRVDTGVLYFLHETRWVHYTLGVLDELVRVNVYVVYLHWIAENWFESCND